MHSFTQGDKKGTIEPSVARSPGAKQHDVPHDFELVLLAHWSARVQPEELKRSSNVDKDIDSTSTATRTAAASSAVEDGTDEVAPPLPPPIAAVPLPLDHTDAYKKSALELVGPVERLPAPPVSIPESSSRPRRLFARQQGSV